MTACRSTGQYAVGLSQRYGPVPTDHRHLECDRNVLRVLSTIELETGPTKKL